MALGQGHSADLHRQWRAAALRQSTTSRAEGPCPPCRSTIGCVTWIGPAGQPAGGPHHRRHAPLLGVYFVRHGGLPATSGRISSGLGAGPDVVMRKTTRFDAADYLDTEERQVASIMAALETGDADLIRDALGLIARARGTGQIAKKAGLV
jgi:hypothetical protein